MVPLSLTRTIWKDLVALHHVLSIMPALDDRGMPKESSKCKVQSAKCKVENRGASWIYILHFKI